MPPGHVGSDPGEASAGPLGVRLGDNGGLGRVHRLARTLGGWLAWT
jgi:hypothetical protein